MASVLAGWEPEGSSPSHPCTPSSRLLPLREAYEAQTEGEGLSPSLPGALVGNEDMKGRSKGKCPNPNPALAAGGGKGLPEKGGEWTRVPMASSPLTPTTG